MGIAVTGLVIGPKLAVEMRRIQVQRFRFGSLLIKRIMREVGEVNERVEDPATLIGMTAEFDFDDLRIFREFTRKLGILGMLACIQPQVLHIAQVGQAILLWRHL